MKYYKKNIIIIVLILVVIPRISVSENLSEQYLNRSIDEHIELSCWPFINTELVSESFCKITFYKMKSIILDDRNTLLNYVIKNPESFIEFAPNYLMEPDESFKQLEQYFGVDQSLDLQIVQFKKLFNVKSKYEASKIAHDLMNQKNRFCRQEKNIFYFNAKKNNNIMSSKLDINGVVHNVEINQNHFKIDCNNNSQCFKKNVTYMKMKYLVIKSNCNRIIW